MGGGRAAALLSRSSSTSSALHSAVLSHHLSFRPLLSLCPFRGRAGASSVCMASDAAPQKDSAAAAAAVSSAGAPGSSSAASSSSTSPSSAVDFLTLCHVGGLHQDQLPIGGADVTQWRLSLQLVCKLSLHQVALKPKTQISPFAQSPFPFSAAVSVRRNRPSSEGRPRTSPRRRPVAGRRGPPLAVASSAEAQSQSGRASALAAVAASRTAFRLRQFAFGPSPSPTASVLAARSPSLLSADLPLLAASPLRTADASRRRRLRHRGRQKPSPPTPRSADLFLSGSPIVVTTPERGIHRGRRRGSPVLCSPSSLWSTTLTKKGHCGRGSPQSTLAIVERRQLSSSPNVHSNLLNKHQQDPCRHFV